MSDEQIKLLQLCSIREHIHTIVFQFNSAPFLLHFPSNCKYLWMNRQRHICTIVLRSSLQFYPFTRKLIKNKLFTTFVVSLVSSSCSYYPKLFSFYCHYKYFIYLHRNVHYILGYFMTIISFFFLLIQTAKYSLYIKSHG